MGQAPDLYVVNIRGIVTSAEDGTPISYAHIINPRVHGGTTTNADGMFAIRMLTEDTLIIRSLGFVDQKLMITEFPPRNLYQIAMSPVRFLLDEVTVNEDLHMRERLGLPNPDPLNIPTELRGDAFNEKPPWFAAFLSPISFLQYHTSKKEKEKREVRRIIQNNQEWLTFSRFFNLDNIERLTGLHDTDADNFMMYCNLHNQLPYFASQLEIEFQIMDLYFKYKKEMAENKKE
ncbi:MAG: carboxypeptidase-like regulatory domain-containing protein [Prolixibacteraceae bacterium]